MFKDLIGKTMDCCVHYMVVKILKKADHHNDLLKTFDVLKKYKMKVNPSKCAFEIQSSKFLGFMVTRNGIEVDPMKIRAKQDKSSPTCKKDVQQLTGKLTSLNRFVARLSDMQLILQSTS